MKSSSYKESNYKTLKKHKKQGRKEIFNPVP